MSQIIFDPDQADGVSSQFNTKRGELDALIQNARTLMNNFQAASKGQRVNTIMGEWNGMKVSLDNAIAAIQQTSDLLRRAANDFRGADSAK
jgi:WXG100 family type VII secretion target